MIPTRIHGMIDYAVGLLLIVAPWLLGFADGGAAQWVPILLGLATIGMSLITDYELSVAKLIPLRAHLRIDMASGLLLAASPWLFGFSETVFLPHLIVGLMEIAVPAMTAKEPQRASGLR